MKTTIILAAVSLLAVAAFAAPVAIPNPGFDFWTANTWATAACNTPNVPGPGCYTAGNVNNNADWVASGPLAGQYWPGVGPGPTSPSLVAYISGNAGLGPTTISQVLGTNAISGNTYTLTVDIGDRVGALNPPAGYWVALYEGANQIFKVVDPAAPGDGAWSTYSTSGVASGNGLLKIEFGVPSTTPAIGQVWFDTVSLDSVPEPATFALGGLGLLGIGILSRRRRA